MTIEVDRLVVPDHEDSDSGLDDHRQIFEGCDRIGFAGDVDDQRPDRAIHLPQTFLGLGNPA